MDNLIILVTQRVSNARPLPHMKALYQPIYMDSRKVRIIKYTVVVQQ